MKNPDLLALQDRLGEHLHAVVSLFKPEARSKVMLVILNEGFDDGDVVIGDAEPAKAIAAIVKLHGKGETV